MADPVSFILGTGLGLGQLAICVLGVLVITSEYSTGAIRSSLLAVPRRLPMLAAKAVVFAALVLIVGEIVAFPLVLHRRGASCTATCTVSLSDPGVPRAVVGAGLYLTVLGLFALAIGGPHPAHRGRHHRSHRLRPGAAPADRAAARAAGHARPRLPARPQAGQLIGQAHQQASQLLSPWQGFGVFCLWTAVLLAVAGYLLKRRDA